MIVDTGSTSSIFDSNATVKRRLLFEGQPVSTSIKDKRIKTSTEFHFNTIGPSTRLSKSSFHTIGPFKSTKDIPSTSNRENKFATVRRVEQLIYDDIGCSSSSDQSKTLGSNMRKRHKLMKNIFDTVKLSSPEQDETKFEESGIFTLPSQQYYGTKKRPSLKMVMESFESKASSDNTDGIFTKEQLECIEKKKASSTDWFEIHCDKQSSSSSSTSSSSCSSSNKKTLYQKGKNWFKTLGRKDGFRMGTLKVPPKAKTESESKGSLEATSTFSGLKGTIKFLRNPLSAIIAPTPSATSCQPNSLSPMASSLASSTPKSSSSSSPSFFSKNLTTKFSRQIIRPLEDIKEEEKENLSEEELAMLLRKTLDIGTRRKDGKSRVSLHDVFATNK